MTYRTYHNSLKFLNYIKFKNRSKTFLTPCTLHIIFTVGLSALLKIATSFSLKHDILLLIYLSFTKTIFFQTVFYHTLRISSILLCSCSHCSFTFSTGIQPITNIAKSLNSFHFITHYLWLHFSHTICCFITFATNKKSCCIFSYFL